MSNDSLQLSVETLVLCVYRQLLIDLSLHDSPFHRVPAHEHLHCTAQSPHHQSSLPGSALVGTCIFAVQSSIGQYRGCGLVSRATAGRTLVVLVSRDFYMFVITLYLRRKTS